MTPRIALLLVLFLASPIGPAAGAGFSLRYRLVDRFSFDFIPEYRLFTADMNRDGQGEVVRAMPGRALLDSCWTNGAQVLWDAELDSAGTLQVLGDATGDGYPDLLVTSERGGGFWVSCHDPRSFVGDDSALWSAGPFLERCRIDPKMGTKGHLAVFKPMDADGDGRPEVYVLADPYAPGVEPRWLLCLDGLTGRERWRHELACSVSDLELLTRRGGRERHLVLGTYSPQNGFSVNGEDDYHCYVTSLSPDGRREWSVRLGGGWCASRVALADLDADGEPDIVATTDVTGTTSGAIGPGVAHLIVLDPASGATLRSVAVGNLIRTLTASDLDGDGRSEILVLGRDQVLRCYDHRLKLRWVSRARPIAWVVTIADLSGDRRQEIVCTTSGNLKILDAGGRLLVEKELPGTSLQACLLRIGGSTCLAMAGGHDGRAVALEPPTVSPAALALSGGALMIGTGWVGYVVRRRRRHAESLVEEGEAQDRLLEAMIAFGHSGASLGILDRLRFHLKNWDRVRTQDAGQSRLASLLDDFLGSVLPDLIRLVSLARRAQVRSQYWRPLATQALRVSGELQQLLECGPALAEERVRRAEAGLEQLESCLRGIRAHLRQVFQVPVEAMVRKVIARRAADLAAAGVEIGVESRCPPGQAAFVAPSQLEKALENLIENALRAMQGVATPRLTVTLACEGAHCLIDVADSGCGLAGHEQERVFDRDFSTREGGGFGLYYSRQVLARYEGKIFVQKSAPGEGTIFRMVLRTP